jgi:hypothetical protein
VPFPSQLSAWSQADSAESPHGWPGNWNLQFRSQQSFCASRSPSSHCSPRSASTTPLPHARVVGVVVLVAVLVVVELPAGSDDVELVVVTTGAVELVVLDASEVLVGAEVDVAMVVDDGVVVVDDGAMVVDDGVVVDDDAVVGGAEDVVVVLAFGADVVDVDGIDGVVVDGVVVDDVLVVHTLGTHVGLQPSQSIVFPSSQASPTSRMPSAQEATSS